MRTLDAMAALAALLDCADERRWSSLARPTAAGLGSLIRRLTDDANAELQALAEPGSERSVA